VSGELPDKSENAKPAQTAGRKKRLNSRIEPKAVALKASGFIGDNGGQPPTLIFVVEGIGRIRRKGGKSTTARTVGSAT
jgi:hypothetical protein